MGNGSRAVHAQAMPPPILPNRTSGGLSKKQCSICNSITRQALVPKQTLAKL